MATQLRVDPHAKTLTIGQTQQYTAVVLDQFRHPMVDRSTPRYTASGNGLFSDAGLFTAESKGHVLIEIMQDGLSGSVGATVFS